MSQTAKKKAQQTENIKVNSEFILPPPEGTQWSDDPVTTRILAERAINEEKNRKADAEYAKKYAEEQRKMREREIKQREESKRQQEANSKLPELQYRSFLSGDYKRNYHEVVGIRKWHDVMQPPPIVYHYHKTSIIPGIDYMVKMLKEKDEEIEQLKKQMQQKQHH